MTRPFVVGALLVVASSLTAADFRIESPENDSIVFTPEITVQGTVPGDDRSASTIIVQAGAKRFHGQVESGRWSVPDVEIPVGTTVLTARISGTGAPAMSIVTRASSPLVRRPPQEVSFDWENDVDQELLAIADKTLAAPPKAADRDRFVDAVMQRVPLIFANFYKGVANVSVVGATGRDVLVIKMFSGDYGDFGQSRRDCGNLSPGGESHVFVGSHRDSMVNEFRSWKPMSRMDDWQLRAEDVARALARSAAHEAGHAMGLVGEPGEPCGWMNGCDDGHNCEEFNDRYQQQGVERFKFGWYIMDPGLKTQHAARLAEPDVNHRTNPRSPAVFNAFNRAYLRIVNP